MADATDEQATNTLKGDECVTDTQADAIEDTCVEDHEGYELEDLKAVVYDIIWNIVVERRALLRNLISAKRFIDYPPPQPKASYKHAQEPVPDGNELMDSAIDSILDVDEELRNVDKEIIREQVLRICENPPSSPLQVVLLEKCDDGVTFKHHDVLSTMFSYLDMRSLTAFSEASKLCREAVNAYARKAVYNLPLHRRSICSNLNYWRQTIDFFTNMVIVRPISRSNYTPIQSQLRMNKSIFPINKEAMKSHIYVSFDYIKPHYIVYCDHMKPMAHTCAASRALDCDNKAVSRLLTLNEFIAEYGKRIEVKDAYSPAWGVPASMVTPAYVCFLFKMTLDTIGKCITKHAGLVEYRRTEYTANATHHITHRIWLQASFHWDFRFGENAQNSLYLNIADHFRWDG